MKKIAMTICGTIITSAIALAQTTTNTPATGTPQQIPNTTGNQMNNSLNKNNGTTNAAAPLNQSPQSLQGMPQSQLAPSTTPTQPSPYQTTPQAPATQTQPNGQSTFQTPATTQPGQTLTPNAPTGVQSPSTLPQANPGNANQPGQQTLPPTSAYPSLNPTNTQQQPTQQNGNQPRQNQ